MRLAVRLLRPVDRSDEQCGMRPCRLCQVFDDAGDSIVAFDQQHVARLDNAAQPVRVAGRERLIAGHFLLKIGSEPLTDRVEHYAHNAFPPANLSSRFGLIYPLFPPLAWPKAIAI